MKQEFQGYRRPNGQVGIRNHILIIAIDECAEGIAQAVRQQVSECVIVTNHYTCMYAGNEELVNIMTGAALNPNVAGVLLLNMGCGSIDPTLIATPIEQAGKPVRRLSIIRNKGTRQSIRDGVALAKELVALAATIPIAPVALSELLVGVKCGGSDTSSGIASNPAVGRAVDALVDAGASCVAGELIELIGCESILRQRAVSPAVADKLERLIQEEEQRWHVPGTEVETMSIGNSVGGLTTLEEKALGALHKTGTRPIQDVLRITPQGIETPKAPGMYLSETTHLCGGSGMHFAALGTQVILWTTGGAGFSNPIVPVIRVSGNALLITEDIDVDVSGIMSATQSVEQAAGDVLDCLGRVIDGEQTAIEEVGFAYCSLYQKDQRLETLIHAQPV
ncbi:MULTISPECIES: UxaA family hydrolase [Oceanimonas]|uniref:Altronate hydrolase n=1 Tax=Oceanimonas doudoroffii TaxID=84158 RepID=A0A233RJW0_9GAMM|nr:MULTISPECIES: UxaA family hydrolase [Oceanimonas]NHH99717.1 (2R)-sulfolactate sulfo-lyase subunit beta [Oceanimonas sp. MB9]OXY83677.1 altronate hydrolase [Oceanimonas doudoroffii]